MRCPQCGETDDLHGAGGRGGNRQIHCHACGHDWVKERRSRCATCGGDDIVVRPRALTSHGRATVQSVVGFQEVPMCGSCDAEHLNASLAHGRAVPADYTPAALRRR